MKLSQPAKIAVPCGIFLLILFLTSSIDFAISSAAAAYLLLARSDPRPLIGAAVVVFITDLILRHTDIYPRLLTDLSIDAYILFIAGVFLYLQSKKDFVDLLKRKTSAGKNIFARKTGIWIISCVLLGLLLFPLLGGYLSAVAAYAVFAFVSRQFTGKIPLGIGLVFFGLAALFLLGNDPESAETLGNYVFLFLAIGTIGEVLHLAMEKKNGLKTATERSRDPVSVSSEQKRKSMEPAKLMEAPRPDHPHAWYLYGSAAFLFSFILFLFLFPSLLRLETSVRVSPTATPGQTPYQTVQGSAEPTGVAVAGSSPGPPPTAAPTAVPLVTADLERITVLVQNGTEISGLAASTAAKLKTAGFKHVDIGNASRQDYTNWEYITGRTEMRIADLIKKTLSLSNLNIKEASPPAGYDIVVIAGSSFE